LVLDKLFKLIIIISNMGVSLAEVVGIGLASVVAFCKSVDAIFYAPENSRIKRLLYLKREYDACNLKHRPTFWNVGKFETTDPETRRDYWSS
jgi:hypothetical protein